MDGGVRRVLNMAEAVLLFVRAYVLTDQGIVDAVALFGERLAGLKSLLARSADGRLAAKRLRENRDAVRAELERRHLRHLVSVAAKARGENPDGFNVYRMPGGSATLAAFSSALGSMVDAAKGHNEILKRHGFAETGLAELERAASEYTTLSNAVVTARTNHRAATEAIQAATADLIDVIEVLDGIYRFHFDSQPEMLARWLAARDRTKRPARKASPPAGGGDTKTA